jgi:hypothetical protein
MFVLRRRKYGNWVDAPRLLKLKIISSIWGFKVIRKTEGVHCISLFHRA